MNEKEFKQNYLPRIKAVLDFAMKSEYSDFYRQKYKDLDFDVTKVSSYAEFQKIPFLTKQELLDAPLYERVFVPKEKIIYFGNTSGTTGSPKPLVLPRVHNYHGASITSPQLFEEPVLKAGARTVLILFPVFSGPHTLFIKEPKKQIVTITGDINNIGLTAKVSKEVEIDAIATTVTALTLLATELQKEGYPLAKIKWISIGGESFSEDKYAYLKKLFPNATFATRYGSVEAGGLRGYKCPYLTNIKEYHSPDYLFLEVKEGAKTELEGEGELVQTDLNVETAFPFIRYTTGDLATLNYKECRCGNSVTLKMGGRDLYDKFAYMGATIYSDLIETILVDFYDQIEPRFEMHLSEEKTGKDLKPRLTLKVKLKEDGVDKVSLATKLKKDLADRLFLGKNKTLGQLEAENIFLPTKIEFVEKWDNLGKSKGIVSHI